MSSLTIDGENGAIRVYEDVAVHGEITIVIEQYDNVIDEYNQVFISKDVLEEVHENLGSFIKML